MHIFTKSSCPQSRRMKWRCQMMVSAGHLSSGGLEGWRGVSEGSDGSHPTRPPPCRWKGARGRLQNGDSQYRTKGVWLLRHRRETRIVSGARSTLWAHSMRVVQVLLLKLMPHLLVFSWVLSTPQTEIPAKSGGIDSVPTPQKYHLPTALIGAVRVVLCWPISVKGWAESFLCLSSLHRTKPRALNLD